MRLIWLFVSLTLLVSISCNEDVPATRNVSSQLEKGGDNDTLPMNNAETELSKLKEGESREEEELPILPPLILLDFADDLDNSTSSDEKSKRTVNNGLGYGYLRNNLFNGKTNFYFPGGKSGTTVSIEESISPFEPKTIVEQYKPITERPEENPTTYQPRTRLTSPGSQVASNNYAASQAVFGQRTKLHKVSPTDYSYQSYSTTPNSNIVSYTTARPDYRGVNQNAANAYTTAQPNYQDVYTSRQTYSTARPNYDSYPTSTPATYDSRYTVASFNQHRPSYEVTSTPRSLPVDPTAFNLPRYTVENGIRYENKIIWKYPDGRVVNGQATSYVNPNAAYTEYANQPKINPYNYQNIAYQTAVNHQPAQDNRYPQEIVTNQNVVYQNQPSYQALKSPAPRYPQDSVSNIHSQRPAQFPTDPEPAFPARQSAFISAASLSSPASASPSQAQGYDFSYQNKYGLRQRGNVKGTIRYEQRPVKYAIDSPNADYVYSTESPVQATTPSTNLFTTSGKLSPNVLSKYTPQAQQYLSKVFANNPGMTREQLDAHLAQYTNTNYENLLQYNPSISQYIRDPSSILNAQPTFIQAGKSLIPVIILRVDGAAPIQPKATPNINLKALLQQYLSEYAGSKAALSQNTNYEYGRQSTDKPINQSPFNELSQLTQVLSRFSPSYEHDSNANQKLSQLPLDYSPRQSYPETSYDTLDKEINKAPVKDTRVQYGTRTSSKLQKVKSVEIIEDPRFPNYKKTN